LLFAQAGLDLDPAIYASQDSWDDSVHHHAQPFLLKWELSNFLPGLAWNQDPPNFCFQ
jgi:hypothetical protein